MLLKQQIKDTIAYKLGRFICDTRYEDISQEALWRGKMCILDMLGVIMAAWPEESSQIVYRWLTRHSSSPESSVLGSDFKLPAAHATMMNSMMAHSLELEDHHSHKRSLNHPGVCTIPAALAIAERERKNGREFLTAVVLGYEIGSRISAATKLGTLNLQRGFHESSVVGPFSAAAVAGKLLGIAPEVYTHAFGICGSMLAGSMEFKSSEAWSKRLQVGNAGRNGVMAVELAVDGFTGPPTVFEGKHGFYHSYVHAGNYDLGKITPGLGESWDIAHIQYKPYACAGVLHSAMTAALKARENPGFDIDRIQSIRVRTATKVKEEYAEPVHQKIAPLNPVGAQFSLQYSVAVMLVKGKALLAEFSPETIRDPQVLRMAERIIPETAAEIDAGWPGVDPTELILTFDDGQEITVRVEEAKGDLANPVTDSELLDKFRELTAPYLAPERINQVIDMCQQIERVDNINHLTRLLVPNRK